MGDADSRASALFVRYVVAATLFNFSMFSLTYAVDPAFNVLDTSVRYLATLVGGAALVVVVLIAFKMPRLLDFRAIEIVVIIGLIAGGFCALFGLQTGNVALLALGACCSLLARDVIDVLLGLAIADLPRTQIVPCITLSFLAAWVLQLAFSSAPLELTGALFVFLPLVPLLLVSKAMGRLFPSLQESIAPAEVSVTQPKAFLPFGHQLFVCTFLFIFAHGCAVGFDEGEGGLPQTLNIVATILLLAGLALVAGLSSKRFNMDKVFALSAFLVIAGFVFIPFSNLVFDGFANMLLSAGSNCFRVLIWCVFALIAQSDKQRGIIAFAWGRALIAFGVVAGTFLGRTYNGLAAGIGDATPMVSAVAALLFLAYVLFALKDFSLTRIVKSVDADSGRLRIGNAEPTIEASCTLLGERCGLTPREVDVLVLVAKGRNAPFIEEKLVISRNTVKSHVKHIYRKLDVHTNQELIDLVESVSDGAR